MCTMSTYGLGESVQRTSNAAGERSEESSYYTLIFSSDLHSPWASAVSTHSYRFILSVRYLVLLLIPSSWSQVNVKKLF